LSVQSLSLALFSGLVLLGAVSDLRSRMIPNALSVVLAVLGIGVTWLEYGGVAAGSAFIHLLIALVIGMVLYALGMWGGGDAKFYAGSAAWFTLADLPPLIVTISLAGLLLLIVWFIVRRLRIGATVKGRQGELPYGVAIAAGGIVTAVAPAL
jgi:prepilin peptidase CpaA